MKKREKPASKPASCEVKRPKKLTCFLSEEEAAFIDAYLRKNKITNRSRWMRETLLLFIYKDLNDNYPTLFDEHDMRR